MQVDVRALPHESFGAAMQYFTGSKEHNVATPHARPEARADAQRIRPVPRAKTIQRVAGADRRGESTSALGLRWIPPELRENSGRDRSAPKRHAAQTRRARRHARRPAHAHHRNRRPRHAAKKWPRPPPRSATSTSRSPTIRKRSPWPTASMRTRVVAFARQVRELNPRRPRHPCLLRPRMRHPARRRHGPGRGCAGRARSRHRQRPQPHESRTAEMTDRLLRALECPSICAFWVMPRAACCCSAKPIPSISSACRRRPLRRSVLFEINASPERLDLPSHLVRLAKRKGCRFTISTDAHRPAHLNNMPFGVVTARRGWLEAADVLNARPVTEFENWLRRQ